MATEKLLIDLWGINMEEVDTSDCTDVDDILSAVVTYLSELPTVDAVEVVRCKDCIHHIYVDMGDDIGEIGGCELLGCAMPYDAFCSYGERRTDEKAD